MHSFRDLFELSDEEDEAEVSEEVRTTLSIRRNNSPTLDSVVIPQLSLSTEDKIKLLNKLDEWRMKFLYQTFVDECVGLPQMYRLNGDQISKLFSKYSLRVQIEFEQNLYDWRQSIEDESVLYS